VGEVDPGGLAEELAVGVDRAVEDFDADVCRRKAAEVH